MERPMPEKPPRNHTKKGIVGGGTTIHSTNTNKEDDQDHHTLATATTAAETICYSTDQGDDASEAGMEVVMSKSEAMEGVLFSSSSVGSSSRGGAHYYRQAPRGRSEEAYQSHSFPAGKHTFTVDKRYAMIRVIGSGAYGVVISAKDTNATSKDVGGNSANSSVAIKMVPKAFSDEIDAKRILREIKLLNHFQHDNIVNLIDMMPPNVKYLDDFTDVYMVTELMETDLHRIIYSKQKLSIEHVQYFIYQVLRGLKYIHSCRVLHRDLKPSNLLVNSNCDLKICDFGLARGILSSSSDSALIDGQHPTLLLTEYVVTRWYRAPEIMLACHEYSYPIDVWSVGCIFAELVLRKPYFPGDDYIDQVRLRLRLGAR
jgi:mitogen-activated protein kinase 1/3